MGKTKIFKFKLDINDMNDNLALLDKKQTKQLIQEKLNQLNSTD